MLRKNWSRAEPTSFGHAMELCKDYARDVHNLSVAHIAEAIDASPNTIYGWLSDESLPGRKIWGYQHACRADFISRYLVHGGGALIVKIPLGRYTSPMDIAALQDETTKATAALIQFASGKASESDTYAALTRAMEAMAYHRANIGKSHAPELDFGGEHG